MKEAKQKTTYVDMALTALDVEQKHALETGGEDPSSIVYALLAIVEELKKRKSASGFVVHPIDHS